MTIFRSHKHMYAQVIDDADGRTLASASTVDKEVAGELKYGGNKAAAERVGTVIAQRAIAAGITKVAFDRGDVPVSWPRGRLGRGRPQSRSGFLTTKPPDRIKANWPGGPIPSRSARPCRTIPTAVN